MYIYIYIYIHNIRIPIFSLYPSNHLQAEDSHYILSFFQLMDIFGSLDEFGRMEFPAKKWVIFKGDVNLPEGNQCLN